MVVTDGHSDACRSRCELSFCQRSGGGGSHESSLRFTWLAFLEGDVPFSPEASLEGAWAEGDHRMDSFQALTINMRRVGDTR